MRDVTGVDAPDAVIQSVFERLQLGVAATGPGAIDVTVPSFRRDLEREIDLVEEFARIHGLAANLVRSVAIIDAPASSHRAARRS